MGGSSLLLSRHTCARLQRREESGRPRHPRGSRLLRREIYNNTPQDERESKHFRLPPIIPAVLYNGAGSWTAVLSFKEMLNNYQEFSGHLLDFRYLLFDVNRYSEEELVKAANVIASIFLLDQKAKPKKLVTRLQKLAGAIKIMTPDEFRHITSWLKHVIKPKMPASIQTKVDCILDANNPLEVEQMISNLEIALFTSHAGPVPLLHRRPFSLTAILQKSPQDAGQTSFPRIS